MLRRQKYPIDIHTGTSTGHPALGAVRQIRDGQLWFSVVVVNAAGSDHRMLLEALVDTGCLGGLLIAFKLWFALRRWRYVTDDVPPYGRGLLHAADSAISRVSPMQFLWFPSFPSTFPPERKVFSTTVKVLRHLRYGLIASASFCYQHQSEIIFEEGKRFQLDRSSKRVPFLNRNDHPCALPSVNIFRTLTARTAHPPPPPLPLTPQPLSIIASLPATNTLAFESEATV